MPLLFPFGDDVSTVAAHRKCARDLAAGHFAFAQQNEIPVCLAASARVFDVDVYQPVREIGPYFGEIFAHSVWVVGIPERADRRATHAIQHGGDGLTLREVIVRLERDRDAGSL